MHVNQTLVQLGNGSAYLLVGHLNPPLVEATGGGTELTQEMVEGKIFPIVPVSRVQMSLDTLVELRGKIDEVLAIVAANEPKS